MKTYILIYLDKGGNELDRREFKGNNIAEARKFKDRLFAESMINDLHKIIVKKKTL